MVYIHHNFFSKFLFLFINSLGFKSIVQSLILSFLLLFVLLFMCYVFVESPERKKLICRYYMHVGKKPLYRDDVWQPSHIYICGFLISICLQSNLTFLNILSSCLTFCILFTSLKILFEALKCK